MNYYQYKFVFKNQASQNESFVDCFHLSLIVFVAVDVVAAVVVFWFECNTINNILLKHTTFTD